MGSEPRSAESDLKALLWLLAKQQLTSYQENLPSPKNLAPVLIYQGLSETLSVYPRQPVPEKKNSTEACDRNGMTSIYLNYQYHRTAIRRWGKGNAILRPKFTPGAISNK